MCGLVIFIWKKINLYDYVYVWVVVFDIIGGVWNFVLFCGIFGYWVFYEVILIVGVILVLLSFDVVGKYINYELLFY